MINSWFQTDEAYNFYNQLGFIEPFRYTIERNGIEKGRLIGYIQKDGGRIKKFFSRRAVINGGISLENDITTEEIQFLLKKCKKSLKKRVIFIEIRNYNDYEIYKSTIESTGFKYHPHYNFHIDTSSMEIVEANLGKSRKRDIKISFREGAVVDENPSLEDVKKLFEILTNLYTTKVKTPFFPFSFFEKLYYSSFGKIIVVKLNGEVIGGTVLVLGKEGVVYEWFACGQDGQYKNIYPSTCATYAGIKFATEQGYVRFDMMGAGTPNDGGYGVRDFKAKFGGTMVEHGRFLHICNPLLFQIGRIGVWCIKHINL